MNLSECFRACSTVRSFGGLPTIALALLAGGCATTDLRKSPPTLRLNDRPIAFVGDLREVTLVVRGKGPPLQCTPEGRDGRALVADKKPAGFDNSCGCELATFDVTRWLGQNMRNSSSVQLSFRASEWCEPITPVGIDSSLVVWDEREGDPEILELTKASSGERYFVPRWSMTLAGVPLEPLLVDQPIQGEGQPADGLTKEQIASYVERGACKREERYFQCRAVPLDAFIKAVGEKASQR